MRLLERLVKATSRPHRVEVVYQGGEVDFDIMPDGLEMQAANYRKNVGVGPALVESIARFMVDSSIRPDYWAKVDDDALIPYGCWDDLIDAMEMHNQTFPNKTVRAMANVNPQKLSPQMVNVVDGRGESQGKKVLRFTNRASLRRSFAGKGGRRIDYAVCDQVGHGATVFDWRLFSDHGLMVDSNYIVGGVDIDFTMQIKAGNCVSLLCGPPFSQHFHAKCSDPSGEYNKIRYNKEQIRKSGAYFEQKWGVRNERLTFFGR
jgi:hypothetical protein